MENSKMQKLHSELDTQFQADLENIKKISSEILGELQKLNQLKNKVQSDILAQMIEKNYNIGANIYLRFQEVADLYTKCFELLYKRTDIIRTHSIKYCEQGVEKAKTFTQPLTLKSDYLQMQSSFIKNMINTLEVLDTLDHFTQVILLNSVYLSFYSSYLPFTVDDKDKFKVTKEKIQNLIKSIGGCIPVVSEALTTIDIAVSVSDFLELFDEDTIKDTSFNNIDNGLLKIELQRNMLYQAFEQQQALIESLTEISKRYEENIKELEKEIEDIT